MILSRLIIEDDRATLIEVAGITPSEAEGLLVIYQVALVDIQFECDDAIAHEVRNNTGLIVMKDFIGQYVGRVRLRVFEPCVLPLRLGGVEIAEAEDDGHESGRDQTENALHVLGLQFLK